MVNQKTETFLCWLFGHKFSITDLQYDIKTHRLKYVCGDNSWCYRCGIDKEPK